MASRVEFMRIADGKSSIVNAGCSRASQQGHDKKSALVLTRTLPHFRQIQSDSSILISNKLYWQCVFIGNEVAVAVVEFNERTRDPESFTHSQSCACSCKWI